MNLETQLERRALLGGALGAVAWLATGCDGRSTLINLPARGEHSFSGLTMGTSYTVKIAAARISQAQFSAAQTAVAQALADVVASMSHYDKTSELSRLNRQALGRPMPTSAALRQVVETAQAVHRASSGAFDITLGEVVNAWGFGPRQPPGRVPKSESLHALQRQRSANSLQIDQAAGTLTRHTPISLDLSGIAKGFGVDRSARALATLGIGNFMVEVGGEIRAHGLTGRGSAWQLAIERPDALPQRALRIVPLQGQSLATSGDYRNYFVHGGRRYSHEIDPDTAAPVRHALASVSVVAGDCTLADAWSTALFVLGPERGFDIASAKGLAAYFVLRRADGSFGTMRTPAFDALDGSFVA
jgi:thiamine biosynthesis lipoprotein